MTETARPTPVAGDVRLSVVGDAGRVDIAVSPWTRIDDLAETYREHLGAAPVSLCSPGGTALAPDSTVHDARLRSGGLLVALPRGGRRARPMPAEETAHLSLRALREGLSGDAPPADALHDVADGAGRRVRSDAPVEELPDRAPDAVQWTSMSRGLPLAVALMSVLATFAAMLGSDSGRTGAAVCLLLVAVLVVLVTRDGRTVDGAWLSIAPVLTASAGILLVPDGFGRLQLTVAVAALVAAATAAALRTGSPGVADDELLTWLVSGVVVAVLAVLCLLPGWPDATLWALIATAGVIGLRALPGYAISVPDHVLLEIDRLATTAWTARERKRRSFRGVLRADDVSLMARRALDLVDTGSIACSLAVVGGVAALTTTEMTLSREIGLVLLGLGAGAALVLGGRNLRAFRARLVQRTAGTATLLLTVGWLLTHVDQPWAGRLTALVVALGVVAVVAARAVGRGWSSIWWSRRAEMAETLAGVLVLGAVPLASGLFTWMRVLTSGF